MIEQEDIKKYAQEFFWFRLIWALLACFVSFLVKRDFEKFWEFWQRNIRGYYLMAIEQGGKWKFYISSQKLPMVGYDGKWAWVRLAAGIDYRTEIESSLQPKTEYVFRPRTMEIIRVHPSSDSPVQPMPFLKWLNCL